MNSLIYEVFCGPDLATLLKHKTIKAYVPNDDITPDDHLLLCLHVTLLFTPVLYYHCVLYQIYLIYTVQYITSLLTKDEHTHSYMTAMINQRNTINV